MPRLVKYFFFSLIFLFAVSIFFHSDSAITQDLGRHLTLGKIIWQEKEIPTTNLFSYTYPDYPFTNHHWGSEVIFYLFDNYFSVNGLIQRDFVKERLANIEQGISYTEFSYALLFLVILYKEKEKKFILFSSPGRSPFGHLPGGIKALLNGLWFLPVLQILWINLHISFVYGLAIYFMFLIDRLLSRKIKMKYFILGGCLLLVSLVNPFGWKGVIYPLTIFQNYGYSIVENQSPFFLEKLMTIPTILYFKIIAFLFLLVTPLLLKKKYFFAVLSVFFFGGLSIFAIRNFPFFALTLTFPLALGFTYMREKFMINSKLIKNIPRLKPLLYLSIAGFFLWEIFFLVSNKYYQANYSLLRFGFGQVTGLKNTVDFFLKNKLSGPIFNNFDTGSYLIYRLYPTERVFVDGRPEGYPASFFQKTYIPMQEKKEVWDTVSEKYKFQTIIFSHTDMTPWARQFLSRMVVDTLWQLIYFDDYGVVFVKKDYLEEKDQLGISLEELRKMGIAEIQKARESDTLMRLANFYHLMGLKDLEEIVSLKLRTIQ